MAQAIAARIPGQSLSYPIHIEAGALREAGLLLRECLPNTEKILVVTESQLDSLYGPTLVESLRYEGFQVTLVAIEGGEANKTLETAQLLYDLCLSHQLTRRDALLSLGGGILGDMVGFVAGTYRRGIPFIQCPTSLLAQVDASVGGKVAINYQGLKNAVGVFHQPSAVIIDPLTLQSLPPREFACGMAEIIKTALLQESVPRSSSEEARSLPVLSLLSTLVSGPVLSPESLGPVIETCCQLKAWVVEADPQENNGIRDMLNLGHTLGHAIETVSNGQVLHGEAVAMGLCAFTRLSIQRGELSKSAIETVETLFQKYNLPIHVPETLPSKALLEVMQQDKKRLSQKGLRLILPSPDLGQVQIETLALSTDDLDAIR